MVVSIIVATSDSAKCIRIAAVVTCTSQSECAFETPAEFASNAAVAICFGTIDADAEVRGNVLLCAQRATQASDCILCATRKLRAIRVDEKRSRCRSQIVLQALL